jgi:pimeloyl-ACP methyl ester carboxylesterase
VILVGHSLGALVATELALEVPGDVLGLVLISGAFYLKRPHPDLSLAIAARVGLRDTFMKKDGPDLLDEEAKRTHVCYMEQPLHAAISMREAGVRLRGELFRIHRPTLFLHGGADQVAPYQGAEKAAAQVGTPDARLIVYPRSHHILTRDVDRTRVGEDLGRFFRRLTAPSE